MSNLSLKTYKFTSTSDFISCFFLGFYTRLISSRTNIIAEKYNEAFQKDPIFNLQPADMIICHDFLWFSNLFFIAFVSKDESRFWNTNYYKSRLISTSVIGSWDSSEFHLETSTILVVFLKKLHIGGLWFCSGLILIRVIWCKAKELLETGPWPTCGRQESLRISF